MSKLLPMTTERLRLRRWLPEDRVPFALLNADREVMEFFPSVLSKVQSDAFADRCATRVSVDGWGYFAVDELSSGDFIGYVGLKDAPEELSFSPAVEVAWRLKRSAWGKGYATEAALEFLRFAFEQLELR